MCAVREAIGTAEFLQSIIDVHRGGGGEGRSWSWRSRGSGPILARQGERVKVRERGGGEEGGVVYKIKGIVSCEGGRKQE